jgi:predicted DNA-binding transcriptional regulator AlpA
MNDYLRNGLRFLRLPAVEVRTGLKRQQLFSLGRDGVFPKPVKIAGLSVWPEFQVDEFIETGIRETCGGQP